MAAYPTSYFNPLNEGANPLAEGCLLTGAFNLEEDTTIRFRMVRLMPTQDFSIRCWLSKFPGGESLSLAPQASYWHLNRVANFEIVITSSEEPILNPLTVSYVIKADSGEYYLNALNMTLTPNPFYVSATSGPLDED